MSGNFKMFRTVIRSSHLFFAAFAFLSLFLVIGRLTVATAGVPEVSHIVVTDVTPVSFSVVWTSSEPATCNLTVFSDSSGTQQAEGVRQLNQCL